MPYSVQVTFAPAHELLMSLDAYLVTASHRNQDLGEAWAASVRAALPSSLVARLDALSGPPDYRWLTHLIRQCPLPEIPGFLDWLRHLSPGELYELLAPYAAGGVPGNLGQLRDEAHEVLLAWYEAYFAPQVDPGVLAALEAEAAALKERTAALSAEAAVDEATGGIWLEATETDTQVWLIPQYHKRPICLHAAGPGHLVFYYPLLDLPTPAGQPPESLMRLTRALADESRLRMIYDLAGGPVTFMELVERSGLTKGTVHRHLWALRFARLVRVHFENGSAHRFSLRPGALAQVSDALERFVTR
jgi:DNA-binding transcriptional ArsR family regulator